MNSYGLSTLEIKHLIERALLPDRCICEVHGGNKFNIYLSDAKRPEAAVVIQNVALESLTSSRAIAEVIGEARYRLAFGEDTKRVYAK